MITFAPFPETMSSKRQGQATPQFPESFHTRIPSLKGIIRRRLLVNFRVEASDLSRLLPDRFRPKLHRGHAIAGLCLIRLEQVRPAGAPSFLGLSSENAAHRVAVEWTTRQGNTCEGVYIFRRDTDSTLSRLAGGRLFPGIHHPAEFQIKDKQGQIDFRMTSRAGDADIRLHCKEADALPSTTSFSSLAESSRFFKNGSLGYSPARQPGRFDGLRLETEHWTVHPLTITHVESRWLAQNLPSAEFDHALLMRDIPHRWHSVEDCPESRNRERQR